MESEKWSAVDGFFSDNLGPIDPVMYDILKANTAAGLPQIDVSMNQGRFLNVLVQATGAKNILEVGTLGAFSTIWMGKALPSGGKIITLEADPKHAEVAKNNIRRAGLEKIIEVKLGKALETLPQVEAQMREPLDLAFIDADKANNPEYFAWALKMARKGSIIIVDNVVREGKVVDSKNNDPSVEGVRRLNDLIAREPRVRATVLQTVGTKGWDGFLMAVVC